jgi:hypothetical protein
LIVLLITEKSCNGTLTDIFFFSEKNTCDGTYEGSTLSTRREEASIAWSDELQPFSHADTQLFGNSRFFISSNRLKQNTFGNVPEGF